MPKNTEPENSSKTVENKCFGLAKKIRTAIPNTVILNPSKTLRKTSKTRRELCHGINPPAALLNRGKAVLQGNHYTTNGKRAFDLGTMCAIMCDMMHRPRKHGAIKSQMKPTENIGPRDDNDDLYIVPTYITGRSKR